MAHRRRPSPTLAIALLALFVALGGSSYAALSVGGKNVKNNSLTTKDVKNNSLTGKDIRNNRLGGSDVKESSLGKVNRAAAADAAGFATQAGNARSLGGLPAAAYVQGRRFVSTNGVAKLNGGTELELKSGPFTVVARCVDNGSGNHELAVDLASTEADSALQESEGTSAPVSAGTSSTTAFKHSVNENINLAAPSGATLDLVVQYGVNGLDADCFFVANGFAGP